MTERNKYGELPRSRTSRNRSRIGAVEGGGQAETGPGPPDEIGDSSRDPAEMEET